MRLSGFVEDHELALRYAAADAFVALSEYEGFGLPALEAAARGLPLVVGRPPSQGEIFRDAALLVDPRDEHAIAQALDRALGDTHHAGRPGRVRPGARRAPLLGRDRAPDARDTARRRRSMSVAPRVAVVVVSFETRDTLVAALGALERHAGLPIETVVVDNASSDGSTDACGRAFPACA